MYDYLPGPEDMSGSEATVDDVLSYVFAGPLQMPEHVAQPTTFRPALRRALTDIHFNSSGNPIKFPSRAGVFPSTLLAEVPPVVVDANWIRNDVRYACLNSRRTTLVNVANEGLLRLFCSQHVIDEVIEHASEWTSNSEVSPDSFVRRWLTEYLPMLHVLQESDVPLGILAPDEMGRIELLRTLDPDDIPSVTLALALGAFYLSEDKPALRAVYGSDAGLWRQGELLELLRAGGDAGQLGELLQLMAGLIKGIGAGAIKGAWNRIGPVGLLVAAGVALLGYTKVSADSKAKLRSGLSSGFMAFGEAYAEWQSHLQRFREASPDTATWEELAETNLSSDVLTRVCLFKLARVGPSNCSAAELKSLLPDLTVPHGEAKVRQTLRTSSCFFEAWAGRWQVGKVASLPGHLLALNAPIEQT
jgi:predicted nucleic acid-binding protein